MGLCLTNKTLVREGVSDLILGFRRTNKCESVENCGSVLRQSILRGGKQWEREGGVTPHPKTWGRQGNEELERQMEPGG